MMKICDKSVEISLNLNWLYIPGHPYKDLIIGDSGSGKANMLLNLININNQILTTFIYKSKIHLSQNINCLLIEEKR